MRATMLPAIFALVAILQPAHGRVIHDDLKLDLDLYQDRGLNLNLDLSKDKQPNEQDISQDIDQEIQAASHGHSGLQENGLFRQELDIMLDKEQFEILHPGQNSRQERKAHADLSSRWTNNQVWYRKTPGDFQDNDWRTVESAMEEFEEMTCLSFHEDVEKTHRNIVNFINSGGCSSMLGMIDGGGDLKLGKGCLSYHTILHEIGHAIGFYHEQSRADRNASIEIKWENIKDKKEHNFKEYPQFIKNYSVPYDLYSLMHYGRDYFAKDKSKPTIVVKNSTYANVIGHARHLSFYDIMLANRMYICDAKCETKSSCPENSYRAKDCKCYCLGTSRYGRGEQCGHVTETPATDRPATEIPTTETPTTDSDCGPTTDLPTTDWPTTDWPTTDGPTTDWPTTDWPTTDWATTDGPTTDWPTTDGPTTDWPTTDWPTTDWPTTDGPTTDWPTTDWPTTKRPTTKPDC